MKRWLFAAVAIVAIGLGAGTTLLPIQAAAAPSTAPRASATAALGSNPGPLTDCYGNRGVQFGTFDAYLCEVKLGGDPSGSLYYTPSLDAGVNGVCVKTTQSDCQMVWYKLHPASGNFYSWENFSPEWGSGDVRANGRIIGLDEGPAGQCIVVWPSWTVTPTQCFLVSDGGAVVQPPHAMNAQEQATVSELITNMRASIPLVHR